MISALVFGVLALVPLQALAGEVLVFAAASLKTALEEIAADFSDQTGHSVTASFAASSLLARQIEAGAPADLFISANESWMDVVQDEGLINENTRVDLLSNELVLIGALSSEAIGRVGSNTDLSAMLDGGYLAMALVDSVPAGIYGKAALQSLGQWDALRTNVAQTDNVRAALALVATGSAPLGIVYRSDTLAEDRVRVVAAIPSELHPPIVYPAAATVLASPEAQSFLEFLTSDAARAIFIEQGFALTGE